MDISKLIQSQRVFFNSDVTKDVRFRKDALNRLYEAIVINEENILKALKEDLNKSFEITIRGSSDKVDLINKEDLYVELDLTGLDEGSHNVIPSIREEEGITIISIVPENFNITLKKE